MSRFGQNLPGETAAARRLRQEAEVFLASAFINRPDCVTSIVPTPRMWPRPESDDYYNISDVNELIAIVNTSPLSTRFIRLPPGPLLFDMGNNHFTPPANTTTIIDCQGSIVASNSRERPPPTRGSSLGACPPGMPHASYQQPRVCGDWRTQQHRVSQACRT